MSEIKFERRYSKEKFESDRRIFKEIETVSIASHARAIEEIERCYELIDDAIKMAEIVYGMISDDEKDIFTCRVFAKAFLEKVKKT